MVVARALVVIALAGGVCAQQTLSVFHCSGIPALLAERHGPVCNQAGTLAQLQQLLQRSIGPECGTVAMQRDARLVVVARRADPAELTRRALAAVYAGVLDVRVQCTVFTRPALATDRVVGPAPIDEVAAGRLLREALAAGGTIRNLPETGAPPLVPFVATARPVAAPLAPPAQLPTDADVPVRCVALVLGDDEVALTVRLDGVGAAPGELFIRTKVGTGALLTFAGATRTTCVWLRAVSLRPIEPGTSLPGPRLGK